MVRMYPPQSMSGSISANSNYTPQGQVLVLQEKMAYENDTVMGYDNDWFDVSWQKRIQLTINTGKVPSTQTNFPLLINDTYADLEGESIDELRFTGVDNVQLDYEIVEFNDVNGRLIAWFKKPSVSNGDIINIYFDNSSASNEQDSAAVWSDYKSVLHMTPMLLDSTGNNTVTNVNTTGTSGQIGLARNFNGTSAFLNLGNFNLTSNKMTLSAWVSCDIVGRCEIISKETSFSTSDDPIWDLLISGLAFLTLRVDADAVISSSTLTASTFELVHGVYDGINLKVYINGVFEGQIPRTDAIPTSSQNVTIGVSDTIPQEDFFDGAIDEVHILNVARESDWITTEFNNQSDTSAFYSTGTIQSVPLTFDSMGYEEEE